jgi:lysophospholipase L1-like esterase
MFAMPTLALACPTIDGLIDYNCDQRIKIAFVGDSFVDGVGDGPKDLVLGRGYVKRLRERYPSAVVATYGVPGIVSGKLLEKLKQRIPKMASLPDSLDIRDADYIVIDVGRNDYFENTSPGETVKNLFRIEKYLRTTLGKNGKVAPRMVVSTLAPTTRFFQRFFISSVNTTMLKYKSTLPVYLRPDKFMKESLIAKDGIHPKSEGYTRMADIVELYLKGSGATMMLKARKDLDADGVYDMFESSRFGVSPSLFDTDGDTFGDGEELFTFFTDPANSQSYP